MARSVAVLRLALALIGAASLFACRAAPPPVHETGRAPAVAPATHGGDVPAAEIPPAPLPPPLPIPPQAAVEVLDLATGRAVFTQHGEVLDRPTWLASVAKVFTLRAALEAGVVDARTRIPCRGRVVLGPRTLQCVHPAFGRPLSAVEALAHSCNSFFASLRLPHGAVAAAFSAAGLPPPPPMLPEPRLAWIGLDGAKVAPRRALRAFVTVVEAAQTRRSPADQILLDGLRDAARVGTASAFAEAGVDALAKTGTASLGDGAFGGIVVAVSPASSPRHAVVALGSGIAGRDAAAIAASALRQAEGVATGAGHLRLGRATPDGYDVATWDLEDYVAGVVAAEATPSVGAAAREALAIAARSYALAMRGRHAREGFDLCDLTHCQAHRAPDRHSRDATRATAGLVLLVNGAPLAAFHHASCGGALESPEAVWGGQAAPRGVMVARPDPAGQGHEDPWREQVRASDLLGVLRAAAHRGDELRGVAVARRSASGRVATLHLDGLVPSEIDGERFRLLVGRALGWQVLKSSLYEVSRTSVGYAFEGRGRGHGVGLCVAGAARLGANGSSARQILAAYFPGATIAAAGPPAGAPRVELPADAEAERTEVEAVVARQFSAVLRAAGMTVPPPAIVVRFHGSVEDYQRATGQPWWTAGATHGGRIHLLPLDVLRRRGLLDTTLRHELAHAVSAEALAGRPRWVQEGVARHLSGDEVPDAVADPRCPVDEEFAAAASAGALQRLYDRSLACARKSLAEAGGDWRAVR